MDNRFPPDATLADVVQYVASRCRALGKSPRDFGLRLHQLREMWCIATPTPSRARWPVGPGTLPFDTTRYPHLDAAFQAALAHALAQEDAR